MTTSTTTQWAYSIDAGESWEGPHDRDTAIREGAQLVTDGGGSVFSIAPLIPTDVRSHGPDVDTVLDCSWESICDNVWPREFDPGCAMHPWAI